MDKYEQILNDCKSRMNSSLNNFGDNLKKLEQEEQIHNARRYNN